MMKFCINTIIILFACLMMVSCTSKNNFQFKEPYPDWEYMSTYTSDDIVYIKANDPSYVDFRNRIFITVDSSLNILLNNHPISTESFEEDFEYIYTNPKKFDHLPEKPEKAVVLLALNLDANFKDNLNLSLVEKKKHLGVSSIQIKMLTVIQNLQKKYVNKEFGIELSEVSDIQQISVEQKFPLNIAMYSRAIEKNKKEMDRGIASKISPWEKENGKLKKRNIIKVLVNNKNEVYLKGKLFDVEKLTDTIKTMILNVENNPTFPTGPKQAIVSLRNDRKTSYNEYLKVYNSLKKAYDELWEEKSQSLFGRPFESLNKKEKISVKREIPFVLSEAEPTDLGDK